MESFLPNLCKIGIRKDGNKYNILAGFNRNEKMAEVADMLIYFKGGNGTNDMVQRAEKHGLQIINAEIAKSLYYSDKHFSIKDNNPIINSAGTFCASEIFNKYGYFNMINLFKLSK